MFSQCITPVIEGLLPEPHNSRLLDVIFELQQWHAFAKLRMHTDKTLKVFEEATVSLGATLRNFQQTTCKEYETYELPSEDAARGRRNPNTSKRGRGKGTSNPRAQPNRAPKRKELNLGTYKYHCLPDYPYVIPIHGTSDNYTQQHVSHLPFILVTPLTIRRLNSNIPVQK